LCRRSCRKVAAIFRRSKGRRLTILSWRAAPAIIVLARLFGDACAQQADSGAIPPAAAPAPAGASTPEAPVNDDPTDSVNWRDRVTAARQRHADWAACVAAKGRDCSEAPVPDPMDALLNDETLVNGDIVSTPKGLKVFRGQSTIPHSLADFQ
jgi:hypothetical protein